jgi:D-arabinose 1-dehydrogenase-like Zn-dependent alcohol dehydrogenase
VRHTRIIVTHYGGPDALQVIEEECPQPQPSEVRVKVLAAGVSLPDVLAREGVHPETPRVPYTPGWDLVGIVDQIGEGVTGFELGQTVAAMPISGCYAQYVCLPQRKFIPVPAGLDPAEAVAVVLNYITAYQMRDRSAKVKPGQRVLIHGASGGVGTAFLQLGQLAGVEMYGTCSAQAAEVVKELGATPIPILTSSRKSTASPVTVWMLFSTASVGTIYGVRAKRSAKAAASWSTDSKPSCTEEGWLRARQAGGTRFANPRSWGGTSSGTGFCQAARAWCLTVSSG